MKFIKSLFILLGVALALSACRTLGPASAPGAAPTAAPDLAAATEPTSSPAPTSETEASPAPESSSTEAAMPLDPFAINQKLGRGVNLGNALEAPKEGAWGVTLQAEYFALIAARGFDSVRIPIRWSAHTLPDDPNTLDPAFFARVDWAVEQALNNGLAVVINFHHYEEIFTDPAGQQARFLGFWQQVAGHYADAPPELVFEILNEPHDALTPALWNDLLAEALALIRASNPTRTVMVGTAEWGGVSTLKDLQLPEEDRNLIVTVHYYQPFEFTHQGAEWDPGAEAWLGTPWDGTPADQSAVTADLQVAADWAAAHARPVFLGEFGAYSRAEMAARARWTAFVARTAENLGFSWAYWEFCAGFGVYDPAAKTWNDPLVAALLPAE